MSAGFCLTGAGLLLESCRQGHEPRISWLCSSWYKIGADYTDQFLLQHGLFWACRDSSESFQGRFLWTGSLGAACAQAMCVTRWGCWVLRETSSSFFDEDLTYNNLLDLRGPCKLFHSTKLNKEAKFTLISKSCCFLPVGKFGLLYQSWSIRFCIDIPNTFSVISSPYN